MLRLNQISEEKHNFIKKFPLLSIILVFIVSILCLLISLPSMKFFHQDEKNWSEAGKFAFKTFFVERDFIDSDWKAPMGTFGRQNPQIGKYIIGASLWIHGYREFDGVVKWNPKNNLQWHIEQGGYVPSPEELYAARLPIAFLAAGATSLIFLLASLAEQFIHGKSGWVAGSVAAVAFLAHPVIWSSSHRAMIDLPAIFFSVLAITFMTYTLIVYKSGNRRLAVCF